MMRTNTEDTVMNARLEHANIAVSDVDATLAFLKLAIPEFRVRGEGTSSAGRRWVHVGTDDTYLALNEAPLPPAEAWVPYGGKPGLNHLGFVVEDVDAIRERLRAAGYRDSTVPNEHPHRRRVYFLDAAGSDWEFVQYRSANIEERNDYELPD